MYYNNSGAADVQDESGTYDSDYVGVWHLDGTSPELVDDSTSNANDGIFNGSSLSFDGVDDYVNVSDDASLRFGTGDFALEAWFKISDTTWYQAIIAKGKTTGTEWMLYQRNSQSLSFYGDAGSVTLDSTTEITDGKWHHVAVVREGDTGYLYFDGESEDSQSGIDSVDLSTTKLISIGAVQSGTERFWNGTIDQVRIYNRSLSAAEVREHYQGNFSNETGLVLYTPFDEGIGTTAGDDSGNGNDGTLTNGPTWTDLTRRVDGSLSGTIDGADVMSTW